MAAVGSAARRVSSKAAPPSRIQAPLAGPVSRPMSESPTRPGDRVATRRSAHLWMVPMCRTRSETCQAGQDGTELEGEAVSARTAKRSISSSRRSQCTRWSMPAIVSAAACYGRGPVKSLGRVFHASPLHRLLGYRSSGSHTRSNLTLFALCRARSERHALVMARRLGIDGASRRSACSVYLQSTVGERLVSPTTSSGASISASTVVLSGRTTTAWPRLARGARRSGQPGGCRGVVAHGPAVALWLLWSKSNRYRPVRAGEGTRTPPQKGPGPKPAGERPGTSV